MNSDMKNGNSDQLFVITGYPSPTEANAQAGSLDNLVGVRTRSALFKKKIQCDRRLVVIIVVLIIALIVGLVVIACYYAVTKRKLDNKTIICQTEQCIRSAANLKLSMDLNTDPCDDFYKYTCGRWSKEHQYFDWFSSYSSFDIVDTNLKRATIEFFETNSSADEPLPLRQSRDMFQACLDTDAMDSLGLEPIFKYLSRVGLPPVPRFFNLTSQDENFSFDWIKTEAALKKNLDLELFIGFAVVTYNRSMNILGLGRPTMGSILPSPLNHDRPRSRYWKREKSNDDDDDDDETDEEEEAYKVFMRQVMKVLITYNRTDVPDDIDASIEKASEIISTFRTHIMDLDLENSTDIEEEFLLFDINDLQNLTDQFFLALKLEPKKIWETYLHEIYADIPDVKLDFRTDLIMVEPGELPYLSVIAGIVHSVSDLLIELWMWWMAVNAMVMNTTKEMREIYRKSRETISTSERSSISTREEYCTYLINEFMGMPMSYNIADRTFLKETKPKIQQMLDDMKTAFINRVNSIQWMDPETKADTLEKSRAMISYIGFPDWLLNKTFLDNLYSEAIIGKDTHLDNMIELIRLDSKTTLKSLRTNNLTYWHDFPSTVNAFNFFGDNSITVPLGILFFPFYHLGLEVLNYGAIGSVLGHELTHGFDNIGRKFDKFGNYRQWWTDSTIQKFENLTECFVNQYSNYKISELHKKIDGELTLSENLADNGGLHQAYWAYKNFQKNHPREPVLPGFEEYTPEQMFFIAFSSLWCNKYNAETLQYEIHEVHPPNHIRVLGTLTNSYEFTEAFRCPAGSRMNPSRSRCRIW